MSMTEPMPTPKPAKPAKRHARSNKRHPAAAPQVPSEFEGITPADCPVACKADRCVISGRGICAHPHKGGLQVNLQTPEALRRLNAAKRVLGKQKLDLTLA